MEQGFIESVSIDNRIRDLRDRISEIGQEIDAYKARTAAAMGGGVFLLLLGAGAAYDLMQGKGGLWLAIGITTDMLNWIAGAFLVGGAGLVFLAMWRERSRDRNREAALAELEREFAQLLDRKEAISKASE